MVNQKERTLVLKLRKAEGGRLHRNKSESDITTGEGIYRASNPDAEIFTYIDSVAASLGIKDPSSKWDNETINKVNSALDDEKVIELAASFYRTYCKELYVENLCDEMIYPFFNIYVNSKKIGGKGLQRSYNWMINYLKTLKIDLFMNKAPISVDGIIGKGTRSAVKELSDAIESSSNILGESRTLGTLWKVTFINFVKSYYVDMGTDNGKEDKQLQFLRGWVLNRCDTLMDMED